MSTTLTLTQASIALADDTSSPILLGQQTESNTVTAPSEIRRYAGGRDRHVRSPGTSTAVIVGFAYMDRDNWIAVKEMLGQTVLFRDQRGLVVWGVFADISASEYQGKDLLESVTIKLQSVTVSEVV